MNENDTVYYDHGLGSVFSGPLFPSFYSVDFEEAQSFATANMTHG